MRPEQKTKSRTKLYNAIEGANVITGAAGTSATWTVTLTTAAAGDVVVVGGHYFEFVLDGGEDTAGDSAGTAADPHLVTNGASPTTTEAAAALTTAILAETATTGAWGFLYPDDSVGASSSSAVVTLKFWPGTAQNAATYVSVDLAGAGAAAKTVSGVAAKSLLPDYNVNLIDAALHTNNKEFYHMVDGQSEGQVCKVAIKVATGGATPTIIGKLSDTSSSAVEALFATAEPGMYASFMWIADEWHLIEEGFGTALTFTAAS